MAARNGGIRMDFLEEMRNLDRRLERLIKLKEESARLASLSASKVKETVTISSVFNGSRHDFRFRKSELPVFDGTNPEGWIMEAERCFNVHQLTNKEKLEAAVISFEGDALRWHEREEKIRPIAHWEAMKILLLKEFRSSHMGTHFGHWFARKQDGTVRKKVYEGSAPFHNRPEDVAVRKFQSGRKPKIWADTRTLEPNDMGRVMDKAQELKEGNLGVHFRAKKLSAEERKDEALPTEELWKGEEKPAKAKGSSSAVCALKSVSGGHLGDGYGGSSGGGKCFRVDSGLFSVACDSRNGGFITATVSVLKSDSIEFLGVVSGGSGGGEYGSRGTVDFIGIEGGSRRGRSSSLADSGFKSGSVGSLGGDSGGSNGGFHFSGGGGGLDSGGSGMAVGNYFPTWEKPSLNRVEELNRESEADFSAVLGIEPLVLLRPLRDILGACLQIGMVESLGKKMQWRECRRREQSSRLMEEDRGKRKATQWDQLAQVAPAAVSYFPP